MDIPFRSKEVSWLAFNSRVLQEAASEDVPLLERVKFLGIYSSNLDEFFRVRAATLRRLVLLGDKYTELNMPDPKATLKEVNAIVSKETSVFNEVYDEVISGLKKEGISVIDNRQVPRDLRVWLRDYFNAKVRPHIMPVMLKSRAELPTLRDNPMYLAVRLDRKSGKGRPGHALIEIPPDLPRFVVLPKKRSKSQLVMYIDDIIRFGLPEVFGFLPYDSFDSHAIKFTRDAELEFDDDFTESTYEKVEEGLKAREGGDPIRANHDADIPPNFLRLLLRKLDLGGTEALYPGARYHNRKDLLSFPTLGRSDLLHPPREPVPVRRLRQKDKHGFFQILRKKDVLLHYPYHTFNHFTDFLREASIDPLVQSIQLTQYRLAKNSCVAKALISAAHNGKAVTVLVEPHARFDEGANIAWAGEYRRAGIRVILGVPGLKVHSKLCLVTRRESGRTRYYTCLGTGNFNEDTGGIFADHLLMTSHQEIGEEARSVLEFMERTYKPPKLKHLVIAPIGMRKFVRKKIENEIQAAQNGQPASIALKLNNLSDAETIALLYEAATAGVKIRLICRSMFSLITDKKATSGNIEAISIVDKFLEHSRFFIFENGGNPELYLSSADFLPRNFDSRIETIFPIYDDRLRKELIEYFELQWKDNTKARVLDADLRNIYRSKEEKEPALRSQFAIEEYLHTTR